MATADMVEATGEAGRTVQVNRDKLERSGTENGSNSSRGWPVEPSVDGKRWAKPGSAVPRWADIGPYPVSEEAEPGFLGPLAMGGGVW